MLIFCVVNITIILRYYDSIKYIIITIIRIIFFYPSNNIFNVAKKNSVAANVTKIHLTSTRTDEYFVLRSQKVYSFFFYFRKKNYQVEK